LRRLPVNSSRRLHAGGTACCCGDHRPAVVDPLAGAAAGAGGGEGNRLPGEHEADHARHAVVHDGLPGLSDPTDTSAYNLHPSSDERRAARWHLFFNEYTGGEACSDSTYAAWKNFDTFGPVASKVWNGCPVVKKAQNIERYHYGIFTVGVDDDRTVHTYPLFGLRPTNIGNASSAGIIGESNAFALDGGSIQGDTLFYMKDFGLGQRTGTSGFEAFQRHVRTGFNVGYLDGHVDFYAYPDQTWYRTIVYDIVNY
jgi:prepilin-type processing-associated H-X9-DG protein